MKRNFRRKVIYVSVIALLLVLLPFLSQPASRVDSGGLLAKLRERSRLSPAQLGEIDPAGASMSLATMGMRGVAANILWSRALDYKDREDWTNLKATLNQITKLQPHFVSAWRFQAWELSYNVAAEFDDQRHRYVWVKKGVDFLQQGIRHNRHEPLLVWDMGWFFGHKLGRSDDRRQFRAFYADDTDFHETLPIDIDQSRGPNHKPDNWLAAHQLYLQAERVLEASNAPLRGKNPLMFHSDPSMALIYHAIAVEDDGYLNEQGQDAWRRAGDEFLRFGNRSMPTRLGEQVRLNDLERIQIEAELAKQQLDRHAPGVHEELEQKLRAELLPAERESLDTPLGQRSMEQLQLAEEAYAKIRVNPIEIARRAPEATRIPAFEVAQRRVRLLLLSNLISNFRVTVNYDYWRTRCQAEQLPTTVAARKLIKEAKSAYDEADLQAAKQSYEAAWDAWAAIYDQYPILMDDPTAEDVVDSIALYRNLLSNMNLKFPPPGFKLHTLLEFHDEKYRRPIEESPTETSEPAQQADSPAGET